MRKVQIKLRPKASMHLYEWLKHCQTIDANNAYKRLEQLNRQKVIERLHAKTLVIDDVKIKLSQGESLSLLLTILTEQWPGGYTNVVLSTVRDQLPTLSSYTQSYLGLPVVEWE